MSLIPRLLYWAFQTVSEMSFLGLPRRARVTGTVLKLAGRAWFWFGPGVTVSSIKFFSAQRASYEEFEFPSLLDANRTRAHARRRGELETWRK